MTGGTASGQCLMVLHPENLNMRMRAHWFNADCGRDMRKAELVPHGAPHAVESRRAVTLSSAAAEVGRVGFAETGFRPSDRARSGRAASRFNPARIIKPGEA